MNLKDFLTNRDNPPELYWALVIEKGLVQSGIWYVGEGKAEVVGIGTGIPWEGEEELIEATDAALSSTIQKLPENYPEPQKTVFGVSSSWVKNGEITSENLDKIKKLCTELSLTPVGFVVLSEAIAHLFKSEEGSPLNAIVLKPGDESLELSVFKLGDLSGTTEVSRSVSLVDDVIEGLSRFEGITPLPTRFIVYNGKEGDLEDAKQSLIQANWTEGKINFLHTPQVEILETDKKVLATALAGGAEIGNVTSVVSSEEGDEEEKGEEIKEDIEKAPDVSETTSAENLGFSIGEDVSELKKKEVENVEPIPNQTPFQPIRMQPENNLSKEPAFRKPAYYISKSKNLFNSFSDKIIPKSMPSIKFQNKWLMFIGVVLGLGIIATLIIWWFVQTAKVTVYVVPKRVEENVQIIFDSGGNYDAASAIVPAKIVTESVTGEKTKPTTGTKLIGNKATGSVNIANGNSAAINLSAGTIITSSSGFKFTLDQEASVSGQLLPGSPGTTSVNVTAYDIGSQYNLAKGEVFSVGNYSKALVAATSTGDFSGGSSQEISAVSKDDQVNLENDLKNELIQNAKSNLLAKIPDNEIFITDLAAIDIESENFDHFVGDQADSLKLSLTISVTGLAGDRTKLLEYAQGILKDKTPSGFVLSPDQIDFKFSYASIEDGKYTYNAVVGGNFLPDVDKNLIKKEIMGKSVAVATEYLNTLQSFDHAEVLLKIGFPGPLKTIPRVSKNITVDVRPE